MNLLRQIDDGVVKIPLSSKYRYIFVKAHPMKRRRVLNALLPWAKPYPKRDTENVESMDVRELIRSRITSGHTSVSDRMLENALPV